MTTLSLSDTDREVWEGIACYGVTPICSACGVSYTEEGDGEPCSEDGCTGHVSYAATALVLHRIAVHYAEVSDR